MKLVPLSQNGKIHKGNYFAQVDDEDYYFLNQWKWNAFKSKGTFYARRYDCSNGGKVGIPMHRLLMGLNIGDKRIVDHKLGDGLNNQKSNLRIVTHRQNAINRKGWGSSRFIGVSFDKETGKWRAKINFDGKDTNIGRFKIEENAAIAYNIFAEKHHGEFARYNTANT